MKVKYFNEIKKSLNCLVFLECIFVLGLVKKFKNNEAEKIFI
jgi:hypothetical protein